MVILGYNSIRYLETIDNIRYLFQRVYNMLDEDGIFLFMTVQPDLNRFIPKVQYEVDWLDKPIVDDINGITVECFRWL